MNATKKRSLLEDHAREKFNLPEAWEIFRWQRQPIEAAETTYVLLTGAVCSERFAQGPRKGYHNWAKRDKKTECVVSITDAEHDQWLLEWEAKTGCCHVCQGDGNQWAGWSVSEGNRYAPCKRCTATGKPPAKQEAMS